MNPDISQLTLRLLTLENSARQLSISPRHFLNLVARRALPSPIKLGRCSRWRLSDIEAALVTLEAANRRCIGRPRNSE